MTCKLPSKTRCQRCGRRGESPPKCRCKRCGRRGESPLHIVIREQMHLHKLAKRLRVPIAVRRAMVDVIDHCWREVYRGKRRRDR